MPHPLRTFIAAPVPPLLGKWLRDILANLRSTPSDVRWVKADNIHLTLRFLGDIAPSQVPAVADAMDRCLAPGTPLHLAAGGAGVFPSFQRARVIWVGLEGDTAGLAALQADLESALAGIGFKRERRPFRPHLTLGRVRRRIAPRSLRSVIEPLSAMGSVAFEVDRLELYQSTLKPSGAEYKVLHTAMLADQPAAAHRRSGPPPNAGRRPGRCH